MSLQGKGYFRLDEANSFNPKQLHSAKIPTDSGMVGYKDLDEKGKQELVQTLEVMANSLYRSLSGQPNRHFRGKPIRETVKNALNTHTFGTIFSTAVEVLMVNYIRPRQLLSRYLAKTIPVGDRINRGLIAILRGFGMVNVKEVAKGGPLPTVTPSLAERAFQTAIDTKRYGVKLPIEKDLMQSDEYGVLGFLVQAIADGFLYRKEREVIQMLNTMGKVMYDNTTPANGVFNVHTSGRNIARAYNGTLALSDIKRIISYAALRNDNIRYMIIHPFFLYEMSGPSELGAVLGRSDIVTQGPSPFADGWDNPFGSDFGAMWRVYGYDGVTTGGPTRIDQWGDVSNPATSPVVGLDPYGDSVAINNAYQIRQGNADGTPLTIIVTPQAPLRKVTLASGANKFVGDIIFASEFPPVGILQEQNPTLLEWENVEAEVSYMGFVERYAVVPLRQGRGIYIAKNIVADRSYPEPDVVSQIGALADPTGTGIV